MIRKKNQNIIYVAVRPERVEGNELFVWFGRLTTNGFVVSAVLLICMLMQIAHASQPAQQPTQLQVKATQHEKIKLLLVVVGHCHEKFTELVSVIKNDLEFSGQFAVDMRNCSQVSSKSELKSLYKQGYPFALFLNQASHHTAYDWRLYDTQMASMVKGKKYHKRGDHVRGWAHNIADVVWQELTSQEGFFSTKIAYCKQVRNAQGRAVKHIYMADYDGSNEQLIVATSTINVAPRFNCDQRKPALFYSESTKSNIRLMLVDMKRHARVASNFDGINMLPSCSSDGTKLVYCASHGNGNCQLYYYEKGIFKQITHNTGNNISPSLSADGKRVYYCSDFTGKPQIYCYDLVAGTTRDITHGSDACFSPSYHTAKGQLAYAKMVKGTMQLCLYNEKTGNHKQLTFDAGSKDECSWSPCGNYLLYSMELGTKGSIGMLNLMTNENKILTAKNDVCSYPAWSPVYAQYPVVV